MSNQDVSWLNALTSTLIDSVDGYSQAAEATNNAEVKQKFQRLAERRRNVVEEFQRKVRELGGTPEDSGSLSAAAHRQFLNLRSYIQSDVKAALSEVERGEEYLESRFEAALDDDDLSPTAKAFIQQHWAQVNADEEYVESLRKIMVA